MRGSIRIVEELVRARGAGRHRHDVPGLEPVVSTVEPDPDLAAEDDRELFVDEVVVIGNADLAQRDPEP